MYHKSAVQENCTFFGGAMNLKNFCARCPLSKAELNYYRDAGVLPPDSCDGALADKTVEALGIISFLREAGLDRASIAAYLLDGDGAQRVRILKALRCKLKDAIRGEERLLGQIDYLLSELQKKKGSP